MGGKEYPFDLMYVAVLRERGGFWDLVRWVGPQVQWYNGTCTLKGSCSGIQGGKVCQVDAPNYKSHVVNFKAGYS